MIVTCPACATRNDIYTETPAGLLRCRACHHAWIESHAMDVTEIATDIDLASTLIDDPELEDDALAIAQAARKAAEQRNLAISRRRAEMRGWLLLCMIIALPIAILMMFPGPLANWLPGAARLYMAVGLDANVPAFTLRGIAQDHLLTEGTRVLAVRGEVVNNARADHRVPALRFRLKDAAGREVYAWTLNGVGTRALRPGEATSFITRLAAPPLTAREIEIGFAREPEIAVNRTP